MFCLTKSLDFCQNGNAYVSVNYNSLEGQPAMTFIDKPLGKLRFSSYLHPRISAKDHHSGWPHAHKGTGKLW